MKIINFIPARSREPKLTAVNYILTIRQCNGINVENLWITQLGDLSTSENLHEVRDFLRSFGTNPALKDKTISISFCLPSDFVRARKTDFIPSPYSTPSARAHFGLSDQEVSVCDPIGS